MSEHDTSDFDQAVAREHYKRRVLLIHPELQMRLVKVFAAMVLLALLIQGLLFGALVLTAARGMPDGGQHMIEALPRLLSTGFLVSLTMVLPALAAVGIRATFPIAGPVYRFLNYLEEVRERGYCRPVKIRRGDHLHDLADAINAALLAEQARHAEQVEAPRDARESAAA